MNNRPDRMNSTAKPPKTIPINEPFRRLAEGISQLDADRENAYAELAQLRSAHAGSLVRREAIYARKYGAEHPRVADVRARRERSARLTTEILIAQAQSASPTPQRDPESYVLHGFVRNLQRQPLIGLTVSLHDAGGRWLWELGCSCTDEHGHFLLRYPATSKRARATRDSGNTAEPAAETSLHDQHGTKIHTGQGRAEAATTGPRLNTAQPTQAWIRVHNPRQEVLHRDITPLEPQVGHVDYREILLGGDGSCCTPPPSTPNDSPDSRPTNTPFNQAPSSMGVADQSSFDRPLGPASPLSASEGKVKLSSEAATAAGPATIGAQRASARSTSRAKPKRAAGNPKSLER